VWHNYAKNAGRLSHKKDVKNHAVIGFVGFRVSNRRIVVKIERFWPSFFQQSFSCIFVQAGGAFLRLRGCR
jgi:hypothetical protein